MHAFRLAHQAAEQSSVQVGDKLCLVLTAESAPPFNSFRNTQTQTHTVQGMLRCTVCVIYAQFLHFHKGTDSTQQTGNSHAGTHKPHRQTEGSDTQMRFTMDGSQAGTQTDSQTDRRLKHMHVQRGKACLCFQL